MKELVLKIKFDDEGIKQYLKIELEYDDVIKEGRSVEVVSPTKID